MKIIIWFYYLFVFMPWQIFISSLQVSLAVLFPGRRVKPGVVAIPLALHTDWGIALLANSITLTPGTLTLDVSNDKKFLFVHCLALENPEGFKKEIKRLFERKIIWLEGKRK